MENHNSNIKLLSAGIYGMQRTPNADDFATVLGFIEPTNDTRLFADLDEAAKLFAVGHMLSRMRTRLTEKEQDLVYNKLAAFHLPTLVGSFLSAPLPPATIFSEDVRQDFRLNNIYVELLSAVSHTPYFTKFLRSRKPVAEGGKRILQSVAERIVEVAPSWDQKMMNPPADRGPGYYESAAGTAIQIVSTLLAAFVKEKNDSPILVSQETKRVLMPWLRKWERRYSSQYLGQVSNRTRSQLERRGDVMREADRFRRMFKNWDVCGDAGCSKKSDLKVCARCQTVRYCCPEHQRAHWNNLEEPHKKLCFTVEY